MTEAIRILIAWGIPALLNATFGFTLACCWHDDLKVIRWILVWAFSIGIGVATGWWVSSHRRER